MAGCLMGGGSGLRHGKVWSALWVGERLSGWTRAGGPSAGLTWNFFLATKYCMRRMTLMVARWCSRSLRWRRERRMVVTRACHCQRPAGCPRVPTAHGWAPLGARRTFSLPGWGSASPRPAEAARLLINGGPGGTLALLVAQKWCWSQGPVLAVARPLTHGTATQASFYLEAFGFLTSTVGWGYKQMTPKAPCSWNVPWPTHQYPLGKCRTGQTSQG